MQRRYPECPWSRPSLTLRGRVLNRYPGVDDASRPDRGEALHPCLKEFPFTVGLRILVVGERDARSDEHVVFNSYSGRDKDKWSDLAVVAYRHAFLHVYESVYLCVFSDCAAVEVYLVIYA